MKEHYNGLCIKLIKWIYLVALNIQTYILKVLNQLDSAVVKHRKYTRIFYQVLFPPFRTIVSSIGTYNYNCSVLRLSSFISYTRQILHEDSFTFIEEIKLVSARDQFLISFDVRACSQISNCLKELTLVIEAINLNFEISADIKFTKRELRKLFRIATSETHFIFNGSILDQIDGVAMGPPLVPVLANLFMGFREHNWIEQRYMDDIFPVCESESDADSFYCYLNTRHEKY